MKASLKEQLRGKIDYIREYKEIGVRFDTETPNSGGWCQCYAIDREEKKPSAAVNVENGFYTDLGSGQRLDFYTMMQMYGGVNSFWEALVKLAGKYDVQVPAGRPPRSPESDVAFQRWTGVADRWCAMKSTSAEAVHLFGGELCRYRNAHFCVGFKVFSDPMSLDTPSGYVVAQTNGQPIPVYDKTGAVTGECKIKTVSGTGSGLLGEYALQTIREARENGTTDQIKAVFKVEGVTDALALQARIPVELRSQVLVVTNSAGCAERPKESYVEAFEGLPVVLVHDQDEPGQKGLEGWKNFLAGKASVLKVINLPFPMSPNHGKDLKDFFTEGHTFHDLMELVKAAAPIEAATTPAETLVDEFDDDPHRIAREFLDRRFKIPEEDAAWSLVLVDEDWYTYTAGCYRTVPERQVKAALINFTKDLFDEDYTRNLESWKHSGEGPAPKKMKVKNTIISDALQALKAKIYEVRRPGVFLRFGECRFDLANEYTIAFQNGILFVQSFYAELKKPPEERSLENYFLPATPAVFTIAAHDYDYDPDAYCAEWERMNRENLMETGPTGGLNFTKYQVLQEFMGYALIPSNALQAFLLLTGDGANGKSAFLTGICAAFGPENISNISLESFTERFAIANFYGKQLNIVDDLSEVDRTAEGKLKSIVSGSWMSADRKNKDILNFCPTLKLIFACNIEPRFRDTTSGLLRRMKKIPFNRTIPENDRRPEFCTMEYWHPNRAAIMNWCLRGLIQLMDNGMKFTYCQSIEEAKDQYRLEMNPVLQFIQEYLMEEPGRSVAVGSVYHVYSQWCGRNGYKQLNNVNFSKELYRVFRSVSRVRKRSSMKLSYYFQNLKFNPEADIPSEF